MIELNMLKIIGTGFIILGINIKIYVDKKFDDLNNTIKNEKIYVYPDDIYKLCQEHDPEQQDCDSDSDSDSEPNNSIIKIPHNLINNKYSIGTIKLNKITPKLSTIVKCDEYGKIKIINNDEVISSIAQSHLLFPTKIFKEFELDQMMFMNKEIKLLVDNAVNYKSNENRNENLINKYCAIIKNSGIEHSELKLELESVPEYSSTFFNNFELKENFIKPCNDVYLMVNPHSQLLNFSSKYSKNIKLKIIAISDNRDLIVKEKYSNKINELDGQYIISFFVIACGVGLLFLKS